MRLNVQSVVVNRGNSVPHFTITYNEEQMDTLAYFQNAIISKAQTKPRSRLMKKLIEHNENGMIFRPCKVMIRVRTPGKP